MNSRYERTEGLREEIKLRLLKTITQGETRMTQQEFAGMLGISVGKTHY